MLCKQNEINALHGATVWISVNHLMKIEPTWNKKEMCEPACTREEKSKRRENFYPLTLLLPFNLKFGTFKSPMRHLQSCFTVQQHIVSRCDLTCSNVALPSSLSGVLTHSFFKPHTYILLRVPAWPCVIQNTTPRAILIDVHLFFMFFGKYFLIEQDSSRPHCNHKSLALILCTLFISTAN